MYIYVCKKLTTILSLQMKICASYSVNIASVRLKMRSTAFFYIIIESGERAIMVTATSTESS